MLVPVDFPPPSLSVDEALVSLFFLPLPPLLLTTVVAPALAETVLAFVAVPLEPVVVDAAVARVVPATLSVVSTKPAIRTHARRLVYLPSPPFGPILSKWLSPYCHPSLSTCQCSNRRECWSEIRLAGDAYDEGAVVTAVPETAEANRLAGGDGNDEKIELAELLSEVPTGAAEAVDSVETPPRPVAAPAGSTGELGGEEAESAEEATTTLGRTTEPFDSRKTFHSGSNHLHDVVFLSRAFGSERVGAAR